ncbi:putative DNA-binding domain-containing protein [Chromobacterium haemolyticum]|uniref:HvfC/BufC family peptide modification chaperone n=1 Tax=Chromobacterium haemolyticum TaxID=394935 RepID=UPI002448F2A3|nr:putative DNA-binding domain-containing protein [Chromobacterium haemolyticum]MDH0340230.1 putative DNA-binding domain-containing protein [Chromobacterium haemolyticum]
MNTISDIETFSRRLRDGPAVLGDRSIELYRQFLRGNIEDVLTQVFPLFCARLSAAELSLRIDEFLAEHASSSPEFHHIATEFLCFAQPRLSADLRQCLEYEWVLFSVEIDEALVPPPSTSEVTERSIFSLNPTLACIEIQLDVAGLAGPFALFRDSSYQIIQKPLTGFDRRLLETLRSPCAYPTLRASVPLDLLATWLDEASAIGLIHMLDANTSSPVDNV